MDPELKAYLDEMRNRMATKADLDTLRQQNAERFADLERRMATKADLAEMQQENQEQFAALRASDEETRRELGARIDAQGRDMRQGFADITKRLDEGFAERKVDENTALSEIEVVKSKVRRLENRVKLLEKPKKWQQGRARPALFILFAGQGRRCALPWTPPVRATSQRSPATGRAFRFHPWGYAHRVPPARFSVTPAETSTVTLSPPATTAGFGRRGGEAVEVNVLPVLDALTAARGCGI